VKFLVKPSDFMRCLGQVNACSEQVGMTDRSNPDPSGVPQSRWGLFGNPAFDVILVASSVSSIGIAMFDTSMSWLMTDLNRDPLMVSAVQVATTLPMFLLTLPAGALTDIVDPRRLLIVAQFVVTLISVCFAALVTARLANPPALLLTTFLLGATSALAAPAWLLTTPMLVRKHELDDAIAISNASYNVSRAVGPAIGGLAIAAISLDFPFWFYCATNSLVVAALLWWRAPRRAPETLPAERLISAVSAGVRYARNNRDLDSTLIRAAAFFPFASAYGALLPLIARTQLHGGSEVYGALMGTIGLGSIIGTLGLDWLKERLGPDRLAGLATIGTTLAMMLFGVARVFPVAFIASLLAGACWVVVMATLFVSAQVALPEWVRGRGLAVFLTVYFGAMTLGSAAWGAVAHISGLPFALYLAGACALIGMVLTWRWKLQTGAGLNLSPSMDWKAPAFVHKVEDNQGPILMMVEYRIDPKDSTPFLALMQEIGSERKRDGAYAWHVFDDPNEPSRVIETSLVHSLLELRYRSLRVTKADELIEEKARAFLKEAPKPSYFVASKRDHHPQRKWRFLELVLPRGR
jgi:MFS family permease